MSMRYRSLGGTGIKVSVYCLGTMKLGADGNPDHDECVRLIHAALDRGVNFVDTADTYSDGESEEIVGNALRDRRDEVVLATKVHFQMGEGVNRSGNSRRWILTALEESLRRLQTDWIDLYQIHRRPPSVDCTVPCTGMLQMLERCSTSCSRVSAPNRPRPLEQTHRLHRPDDHLSVPRRFAEVRPRDRSSSGDPYGPRP
jgi:aryl-alcohol dehydrogenase-like predicted oxidoreductase